MRGRVFRSTATVTGVGPTGNVNFSEGGSALAGCAAVALAGGGNAPSAICHISSLSVGTHAIVANYGGDAGNAGSTSSALLQVIDTASGGTNVALASVGAVASASSMFGTLSGGRGHRQRSPGATWGNGGGWADATANVFPDWVQINFNGSKTIDRVIVYSLQDNYPNPVEPTDRLTFTRYGLTDFTVQGWNGAAWVSLGSVSGNNLVKRTVTFPAFTTDRIRVNITNALCSIRAWSRSRPGARPPSDRRRRRLRLRVRPIRRRSARRSCSPPPSPAPLPPAASPLPRRRLRRGCAAWP